MRREKKLSRLEVLLRKQIKTNLLFLENMHNDKNTPTKTTPKQLCSR